MSAAIGPAETGRRKRRSVWELALLTVAMFGFGFAMVPLYNALCELTGLNGRDKGMQIVASVQEQPDLSREVTVQFLTVVNGGREWLFKPAVSEMKVHPGQLYTVSFTAENQLDQDVVGQAVPAVTPGKAAKHLKKTECFCFNQQPFKAREAKNMPVRFMLDPELPADVHTVTLSYTFFDVTELAQRSAKPNG
ncbi:MAG: cytochrome c oxidase assembly protein [Nevskiaceae bacterium]|jgi:cytochrome c oxidase assembly protein subunit 11|nr:MAG: cytochrome c oxidase assembly protein [Nevskiaceae bacterium]